MAVTPVVAVVSGQTFTAADYNTYLKDNINALDVGTAAGDLVYWSAAHTPTRLAAPSNPGLLVNTSAGTPSYVQPTASQLVRINSGRTAFEGVSLGAYGIAYRSTDQTGFSVSRTAVTWSSESVSDGCATTSSTRLVCNTAGLYLVCGTAFVANTSGARYITGDITINGTSLCWARSYSDNGYDAVLTFAPRLAILSATQYLEMFLENVYSTVYGGSAKTFLQIILLR
jgi:hypothetical protein